MTNKWMPFLTIFLIIALALFWRKRRIPKPAVDYHHTLTSAGLEPLWFPPDSNSVPGGDSGSLIRYGKQLIRHTAMYLGPKGTISHLANGMTCGNCHLDAGTRPWAGNFGSVASLYPRFSERRGTAETINQRITDCFERSMNGNAPDSNSNEMRAMNAYIRWVGKDVIRGKRPRGTGLEQLSYLDRPADKQKGEILYAQKCASCHGLHGEGQQEGALEYKYPPLWGIHSYNTAAGLYRLSKFAGFVKDNMPFGSNYSNEQLTNEEAWDLAAFVNSQPRPVRMFRQDWPDPSTKPVDLPEGPFPDSFPSAQHKFGPFAPIAKYKKDLASMSGK